MLSIGKLSLAQTEYYERSVAAGAEDYYAGRGESPGRWLGAGADGLGLQGRVPKEAFERLMAGRDPASGGQLAVRREGAVAAFDLTFSAPKSVSVLYAVADEQTSAALAAAHERAVTAALGYLQEVACQVRRGHGGAERVAADGFVTAGYRHRMSRARDPQLHTHCVTANMARGPDGRWTALHARALYLQAKAAGHVYQVELRREVRETFDWTTWGPVRNGMAELEGVEPGVLREFSQRRQRIEEREAELVAAGVAVGDAGRERIAHDTREAKDARPVGTPAWRDEVRARAGEHGLGTGELERLYSMQAPEPMQLAEVWAKEAERLTGPQGLTERSNTFERRDMVIAFAQAAREGASARQITAAVDWLAGTEEVLELAHSESGRFSVQGLVDCEREIITAAARRLGDQRAVVDQRTIEQVLDARAVPLTAEQREAVTSVASSDNAVDLIEALAGTGKTTSAGALAEVYRAAGWQVIGIAPTGRAVRELRERAGIARVRTLAGVLADDRRFGGGFDRRQRTLVVLDEAGMAATREVARLLELTARAPVKVVAIGDPGQLPSVQAGGWLGSLSRRQKAVRLSTVMRQRDARERLLLERLRGGRPGGYVEQQLLEGHLRVMSAADAEQDALSAWRERQQQHGLREAVLITRNNQLRKRLNNAIRVQRGGELGERQSFGERELAVGDRVICRRNDRGLDVDNGTRGTVEAVSADGAILRADSGVERRLPAGYCAEDVEHAYVLTAHGMQGATVEWAGVVASPQELTRNWSYTALSRAREPTELIVIDAPSELERDRAQIAPTEREDAARDALAELTAAMRRRDDEDLAIDHLDDADKLAHVLGLATASDASCESADTVDVSHSRTGSGRRPSPSAAAEKPADLRDVSAADRAAGAVDQLDTAALRAELGDIRRQVAKAVHSRADDERALDVERLAARQRLLRAEIAARRHRHVAQALSQPSEQLIEAIGRPPEEAIARQRWKVRARQIEALRFDAGKEAKAEPPPSLRPRQGGALDGSLTPKRSGPSVKP